MITAKSSEIYIVKDVDVKFSMRLFMQSLKSVLFSFGYAHVYFGSHFQSYVSYIELSQLNYVSLSWDVVEERINNILYKSTLENNSVFFKSYFENDSEVAEQFTSLYFTEDSFNGNILLNIEVKNTHRPIIGKLEDEIFETPNSIIVFNRNSKTYRGSKERVFWYLGSLCSYISDLSNDRTMVAFSETDNIDHYLTPRTNSVSIFSYDVYSVCQILRANER